MKEEIDDVIDDDLTLMLSQSQRDSGADQPSLDDLAASASQVKCNVDRIEAIIQRNKKNYALTKSECPEINQWHFHSRS